MKPDIVLWIYIVLLVVGGLIGFLKANSKASLFTAIGAAALLSLCAAKVVAYAAAADVILIALLLLFGWRLAESKKFMPMGLMLVVTLAALVLRHIV
jgi:uncharacterized membrane protein (UPF0136 family)